jgi:hypothetical protein
MGTPMRSLWWFSPWELWEFDWVILLFFLWGCKPLQFLQSFSKLLLWGFCAQFNIFGYVYPHLCWSDSGRASQGTAIPGSCQQALLGISNSVWVWCLQMGWIPRWDSLWMACPSVSAPYFVPAALSLIVALFCGAS